MRDVTSALIRFAVFTPAPVRRERARKMGSSARNVGSGTPSPLVATTLVLAALALIAPTACLALSPSRRNLLQGSLNASSSEDGGEWDASSSMLVRSVDLSEDYRTKMLLLRNIQQVDLNVRRRHFLGVLVPSSGVDDVEHRPVAGRPHVGAASMHQRFLTQQRET